MRTPSLDQTWYVSRADSGQSIEIAYAVDSELGVLLRRTTNRATMTETVEAAFVTDWNAMNLHDGELPKHGRWLHVR